MHYFLPDGGSLQRGIFGISSSFGSFCFFPVFGNSSVIAAAAFSHSRAAKLFTHFLLRSSTDGGRSPPPPGLPDMMSASEGEMGHGKADVVREVA